MFNEIDMLTDILELRMAGLTEEEIEGYLTFFENNFKELCPNDNN